MENGENNQTMALVQVVFLLILGLIISACLEQYHATSQDALIELPEYLAKANAVSKDSIKILRQEEVAGGLVILYRWQKPEWIKSRTYGLARAFVAPDGRGWRTQASSYITFSDDDNFVAAYTTGNSITPLTTAYGLSDKGDKTRVTWSDGQISTASLQGNAFVKSRPENIQVRSIEVLNASGQVLEKKVFEE